MKTTPFSFLRISADDLSQPGAPVPRFKLAMQWPPAEKDEHPMVPRTGEHTQLNAS